MPSNHDPQTTPVARHTAIRVFLGALGLVGLLASDYLGWTYAVYLGLVFGLLLDIIANRARVVSELLNGLLNAVGSAASVGPC
jgi:hypothetical protein